MVYPYHLLPEEHFKTIESDLKDYFLIRHYKLNLEHQLLDANGDIEDKYLFNPSDRLGDLSTSLLSIFTEPDIYVALSKWGVREFGMYCDNNFTRYIPRYLDHFHFDTDRGYWVVKIGDLQDQNLSYTHTDGDTNKAFISKIIHTPAKWNFWHFSIRWLFEDGKYFYELHKEGKVSKGNVKRISASVRFFLKKYATTEVGEVLVLPKSEYTK